MTFDNQMEWHDVLINPPMGPPFDSKSLEFGFSGLEPPLLKIIKAKESAVRKESSSTEADYVMLSWFCEQWK